MTRTIKDILKGDFPDEDKLKVYFKCKVCNFSSTNGFECPNCGDKDLQKVGDKK